MSHLKHVLAVVLLLPCLIGAGLADDRGRDRGRHVAPRPAWQGEIGRFHEHDMNLWRAVNWQRVPATEPPR